MAEQQQLLDVKARSKTGQVVSLQFAEILEINGKPYQSAGDVEEMRMFVTHLDGRLTAIERILSGAQANG